MASLPEHLPSGDVIAPDVTAARARPMEEMTTEELVAGARAGDGEAYSMLFNRFHDEIYRFATRRVGDHVAGQDIAADTFADAFGGIGRFRWQGAPFEAWLYTIARRRAVDHLRARARAARHSAPGEEGEAIDHSAAVVEATAMRALIARLPEGERDVVELRFMEDLDVEQTARRLGKNPGAVRVAQHRALTHLRRMMAEASV